VGEMSCAEQEIWPGIMQAAGHLGWPVAADALSGGKGLPGVIQHLDFLLQAAAVPHPESILHLGGRLVQRRANELLANTPGAGVCQIRRGPSRLAPPGQNPQVWLGDPGFFCREVILQVPSAWSDEWRESWEEKDRLVEDVLAGVLDGELERGNLSEPGLARWAAEVAVQQDAVLFPGNSMPVRDFDAMVGPLARRVQVTGQRGASGIDGNIAHVAGYARASGRRVLALLGDLAVLHDLNSLPLLRGLPVTIVVPNNHGGGIFRFLPLDMPATTREEFLETPHSLEFGDICRQFGLAYVRTNSASVAGASLANQHGPLLIEVPSDRARNRLKHEQLARSVTDALPAC
jgi:2-succinyl-5-enolpyruvyl-6-hydroxy-3-cyclohexene-1-carboxylate synthase